MKMILRGIMTARNIKRKMTEKNIKNTRMRRKRPFPKHHKISKKGRTHRSKRRRRKDFIYSCNRNKKNYTTIYKIST